MIPTTCQLLEVLVRNVELTCKAAHTLGDLRLRQGWQGLELTALTIHLDHTNRLTAKHGSQIINSGAGHNDAVLIALLALAHLGIHRRPWVGAKVQIFSRCIRGATVQGQDSRSAFVCIPVRLVYLRYSVDVEVPFKEEKCDGDRLHGDHPQPFSILLHGGNCDNTIIATYVDHVQNIL